jgi:hypothetical protein
MITSATGNEWHGAMHQEVDFLTRHYFRNDQGYVVHSPELRRISWKNYTSTYTDPPSREELNERIRELIDKYGWNPPKPFCIFATPVESPPPTVKFKGIPVVFDPMLDPNDVKIIDAQGRTTDLATCMDEPRLLHPDEVADLSDEANKILDDVLNPKKPLIWTPCDEDSHDDTPGS